jgi:long-chain acyl-CoA synthetase
VSTVQPLPDRPTSVATVLDAVVAADPGREALVTVSGRWTYAELDALADRARGAWSSLGVTAGQRVAAALPNDVDVVAAFHGAMRLGAVWVGVNQALAPPEKAFLLADSGAAVLLCDAATREELAGHRAGLPELGEVVTVDDGGWAEVLAAAGPVVPAAERAAVGRPAVDPYAPAALAYTSGTTGHPKGAVHSQHNLLLPGAALVASRGYGPDLRKGDCLPLTILNMLVLTTLLVAQAGGTCVVMDKVEARSVADWIERERVTVWNAVPALLYTMVQDGSIPAGALATLSDLWVGGADCPETLRDAVAARFGRHVVCTYGLSEAPTVVTIDPDGGSHRPGASGVALPQFDLRIVAPDGAVLAPGETGEICLAPQADGPWAGAYRPPLGYWNRPDPSAALLSDGVVHTGDIGFLDSDGFLFVRDRKNVVILRGGANVYPAEVERVLGAYEGVAAAAVVGIPDERLGQRVGAAVQLEAGAAVTEEALRAHCLAELARYKVPERYVFVAGFSRNSMGKIDRTSLAPLFGGTEAVP